MRATSTQTRPETEWEPQPGQQLSILFDVFQLGQRVRTLLATALRDAGLRPDEYAAYSVIFEAGQITMTEMARTLGMPVTTAADYIRAMMARGHVRKEPNPHDARSYLLALTAPGKRAHRRASACFERAYQAFVRELPSQREAATRELLHHLTTCAAKATAALEP
jgi:DNA-binding MarR family transcriptional regulator